MKMPFILTLAGLAIDSTLARVLVVVALLTSTSNATSLQPAETRQDWQDLEVITLDSQGDLFEAFGADASFDVIAAKCSNGRKQYYDRNYLARHRPILLLKFDDKPPADWPNAEHGSWLGPYCVVHESFSPAETIYGYVEQPGIAFAVFSLELTRFTQSLGRFTPKESGNDPEVAKGQKIAVGSCISGHKLGNAGGQATSWAVLAERAVNSKDYFRKYVTDPHSMNPISGMPPHPTFDDNTFNALEAYFKAMMPIE
jgi:hypothetical protein